MKNIYLILAFFGGVSVCFLFVINANNFASVSLGSSDENNLLQIKQQQAIILATIGQINNRLREVESGLITNDFSNDNLNKSKTETVISGSITSENTVTKNENILTDEEIQQTKYLIFDSLSSAIMSVPQALRSPELNALPKDEKFKLISEIIRRHNEGELPN